MTEHWRLVVGWPNYEVSSLGRVRRVGRRKGARVGRILRPQPHAKGYETVQVYDGFNRSKRYCVHQLVAEAFIGRRPDGHHVDHVDGDPTNNHVENLRYVTPAENNRLTAAAGRHAVGRMQPGAKLTERAVLEIRALAGIVPQEELAARFGVTQSRISRVQNGLVWAHVQAPARAS